jgi:hypothetical protein
VKQECPIDSLPKVVILHGNDSPEAFPLPVVRAPLGHAETEPSTHVTALRDQRHPRGAIKGFKASDDSQQFEAFAAHQSLFVGDDHSPTRFDILKYETPRPTVGRTTCFGEKQIVGSGYHRRATHGDCSPGRIAGYGA